MAVRSKTRWPLHHRSATQRLTRPARPTTTECLNFGVGQRYPGNIVAVGFSEVEVSTPRTTYHALVVTPTAHVRVDASRREALRASTEPGPIDLLVLERARACGPRVKLGIFRGRDDDGLGSWGFADDVDEATGRELGRLLVAAQLPIYRELYAMGWLLFAHVDWGARETEFMRQGARALSAEMMNDRQGRTDDIWLLRHLCFFFQTRYVRMLGGILPEKLAMIENLPRRRSAEVSRSMPVARPPK